MTSLHIFGIGIFKSWLEVCTCTVLSDCKSHCSVLVSIIFIQNLLTTVCSDLSRSKPFWEILTFLFSNVEDGCTSPLTHHCSTMKCLMFVKALYCKHTHLLGVIYHFTTSNIAKISIEFKTISYLSQTIYLLKSILEHRPPQNRQFVHLPSNGIKNALGQARMFVCLPVHRNVFF